MDESCKTAKATAKHFGAEASLELDGAFGEGTALWILRISAAYLMDKINKSRLHTMHLFMHDPKKAADRYDLHLVLRWST